MRPELRMWGFKKTFEGVDRLILWEFGERYSYLQHRLRLSMSSYAIDRKLQLEQGIVSRNVKDARNIYAGSDFATMS